MSEQRFSDTEVAEIASRLKRATPGPWLVTTIPDDIGNVCIKHEHYDIHVGTTPGVYENVACLIAEPADANLITHAPTDIGALLADRHVLVAQLASAKADVAGLREEIELMRADVKRRVAAAKAGVS